MDSFDALINEIKISGNYDDMFDSFIDLLGSDSIPIDKQPELLQQSQKLIHIILSLSGISSTERERVLLCIQRLATIFGMSFCSGVTMYKEPLLLLFEKNENFYTGNEQATASFKEFVRYFMDIVFGEFQSLFIENYTIENLIFMAKIVLAVQSSIEASESIQIFEELADTINKSLQTLINSEINVSKEDLNTIFEFCFNSKKCYSNLLILAGKYLNGNVFDTKFVAVKNITKLANLDDNSCFIEWAEKSFFTEFISRKDLHEELYSHLITPATKYFEKHKLSIEEIKNLYGSVNSMPIGIRESYIKLIASVISKSTEIAQSFIEDARKTEITIETANLFFHILTNGEDLNEDILTALIDISLSKGMIDGFKVNWKKICSIDKYQNVLSKYLSKSIENHLFNTDVYIALIKSCLPQNIAIDVYKAILEQMKNDDPEILKLLQYIDIDLVIEKFTECLEFMIPIFCKTKSILSSNILLNVTNGKINIDHSVIFKWIDILNENIEYTLTENLPFINRLAFELARSICINSSTIFVYNTTNNKFDAKAFGPLMKILDRQDLKDKNLNYFLRGMIKFVNQLKTDGYRQMFKLLSDLKSVNKVILLQALVRLCNCLIIQPHVDTLVESYYSDIKCIIGDEVYYAPRNYLINKILKKQYSKAHGNVPFKLKDDKSKGEATTKSFVVHFIAEPHPTKKKPEIINYDDQTDVLEDIREKLIDILNDEEKDEYAFKALAFMKKVKYDDVLEKLKENEKNKFR
ncbi:hypothetical protein TVAG_025800 [Trichomonas vaginalis G3]|uniref:Uncharacterized protein n=1 Tax=Trichomonas vaginalis (strain ATCC PRA-98 / G3) TaxID=412133 RepID=A2F0K2_TRIV3|nr:ubiquitinyl hydrolase protein [Trichomonas vaginalis G3]EAY01582.1 hypothetical protein TVAG_025800 [Trichomonas vaginalis G3]KAI5529803.1 ubiquitinyl hydrolase protein [Trichomonas vaginalis G3]|eukprot:XP_001314223.1 hypothetical protein [Trichomonas vaginalis G3]